MSEPGLPGGPGARPRRVTIAVSALSAALALGVAILWFAWGFPEIAWITGALIGSLIFFVARRHNWARWTLLLVTIGSLVLTRSVVFFQLRYGVVLPLATAIQLVLEALGLFLLFGPAARPWFRRRGPAAQR